MKILVTGASGMVGVNLGKRLMLEKSVELFAPNRLELNLLVSTSVRDYISNIKPDLIIHLAAKVGGIQANIANPVEFLVANSLINTNVITAALENKVPYLLNMGSSCMYPKDRAILTEEDLLSGSLEPTNEGYAIAKIEAALLCRYISKQYGLVYKTLVPCNLYGPHDNFDQSTSHLIPAVISKIHRAKQTNCAQVEVWGDGEARREFMYVDDLVDFILVAINKMESLPDLINVGLGYDYSILDYYKMAAKIIGYTGGFYCNTAQPVGMRQKLLNVSKAAKLGWQAKVSAAEGIRKTYEYFLLVTT